MISTVSSRVASIERIKYYLHSNHLLLSDEEKEDLSMVLGVLLDAAEYAELWKKIDCAVNLNSFSNGDNLSLSKIEKIHDILSSVSIHVNKSNLW
jgi:hypothetical protein